MKFRKSKTAALLLLSACVLMSSCSKAPTEAASGYVITENSYVDYTFEYPEDWEVVRNDGMIMVKTAKDNVSLSCTTFDLEVTDMAVNDYWYGTDEKQGYFDYLKSTLGGTVEVIADEETQLGTEKVPARLVTYTAEVAGSTYRFTQVVGIYSGAAYTLTYTAKPDTHDTYRSALTHAVSSFSFR